MTAAPESLDQQARRLEREMLAELGVAGPGWCHHGLRAARFARTSAEIEAHPDVFRCPTCRRLLDGPA